MEQTVEKLQQIVLTLSDIHPSVCVAGLDGESKQIKEIKGDLSGIIDTISVDLPALKRVVDSLRNDTLSCLQELIEVLPSEGEPLTNMQLNVISGAAGCFACRCQDYSSSLESYENRVGLQQRINGGNNAS